ncbi:MAG: acyl carrier protein [Dehalococcoidia bacterium]
MSEDEARNAILSVLGTIAPEADLSELEPDVELRDQLDIDSMDFLNLAIGLHEKTGVDIPEEDYGLVATLDDCIAYLVSHAV